MRRKTNLVASRVSPTGHLGIFVLDVTKPYEFTGFGAMDVTKPYKFIRFGAIHGPKPYRSIRFGAIYGPKLHKFIMFGVSLGPESEATRRPDPQDPYTWPGPKYQKDPMYTRVMGIPNSPGTRPPNLPAIKPSNNKYNIRFGRVQSFSTSQNALPTI